MASRQVRDKFASHIFLIYTDRKAQSLLFFMGDDKKKLDWKPALEIFGRVSTWVIVPIILALVFGKMLDAHYGTEPWIFLGLTGVAFLFSIFGIVRTVKDYIKKIQPPESPLSGGPESSSPDKGRTKEGLNQK